MTVQRLPTNEGGYIWVNPTNVAVIAQAPLALNEAQVLLINGMAINFKISGAVLAEVIYEGKEYGEAI